MKSAASAYRASAWIGLGVIAVMGLWLTWRAVAVNWFVDADLVNVVMLRDGVAAQGLHFLTTWIYTTDNWVFSLLPAYALVYAVLGETPAVLVMSGWVVFALCAALTALLAARLTGRALVGMAVFALLVCANYLVIGPAGLLGHAVTHNSSLVWCLLAWLAAWRGLRLKQLGWMIAACVMGLLVSLSDPWAMAALLLPALLSSALLALLAPKAERRLFIVSFLLWLLTALLARTRVLHLLSFLPGYAVQRPDVHTLGDNIAWTVRSLGLAFGLMPGSDLTGALAIGVAFAALLIVAGVSVLRLAVRWRSLDHARTWMVLCLVLSILGTTAGAVIGPTPSGFTALHFLVNAYFLVPVLMVVSVCWLPSPPLARVVALWAVLVGATGLWGNGTMLRHFAQADVSPVRAVKPLTDLLAREHLSYGYGPYWGAQANAVTWYSRGSVTIRPVRFDPLTGKVDSLHEQSSRLWALPSDAPPNQATFFLIVGNDGEICPDPARCESAAIAQWGPPARRLTTTGPRGDLVILVWTHPLFTDGSQLRDPHAAPLAHGP
jgi:hypothetical protein